MFNNRKSEIEASNNIKYINSFIQNKLKQKQ